jgi:hypothetical protein
MSIFISQSISQFIN